MDEEKLPFISAGEMKFGKAHYSWKVVADLYRRGLEAAGMETQRIVRPEIYQSKISRYFSDLDMMIRISQSNQ